MRLPLIVYVSGAPGAGKTTLAAKIAAELFVPHVSSDLVLGGIRLTAGRPIDRYKSFHHSFVPLMIAIARSGISFVVDNVLQEGLSKQDIIDKIAPYATIVYIHVYADNPIDRYIGRELTRTDKGVVMTENEILARAKFHRGNLPNTEEAIDIGIRPYIVNTTNGYDPDFNEIVNYISSVYSLSLGASQ